MLSKKLFVITTLVFMTACASNDGMEQQVSTLSNKVDKLTMEVAKLKAQQDKNTQAISDLESMQNDANQRIDNMTKSYTK